MFSTKNLARHARSGLGCRVGLIQREVEEALEKCKVWESKWQSNSAIVMYKKLLERVGNIR